MLASAMTTVKTHEGGAVRTARATERDAATRQHILAVATEAFLTHGYVGTSLSDLICDTWIDTAAGLVAHPQMRTRRP
jgi:hypothetical protein